MIGLKLEYKGLMQDFLQETISTTEFVTAYLNKFKNETRELSEDDFEILDELFGDIDAYTPDESLITENPQFYIDRSQLKQKVAMARAKLN